MDKRVIFAVAGAGKTTHIIKTLSEGKRSIIITYTEANYMNLQTKILERFNNKWPENVTLMTYFKFLYGFCYKPFLADKVRARGITYTSNLNKYAKKKNLSFYMNPDRQLYSNRLSMLLLEYNDELIEQIRSRIARYFDELIIDEVQDIGGRDFVFLENLMETEIDMMMVGDFYQHTYDTSRDGTTKKNLFADKRKYIEYFTKKGLECDSESFSGSWRCTENICAFVRDNMGIDIFSNRKSDASQIYFIDDEDKIREIKENPSIVKLHYQKASKYGANHKNWGETKGEDKYYDVCVLLNDKTLKLYKKGELENLATITKNKLYVAITRARNDVFFVSEKVYDSI